MNEATPLDSVTAAALRELGFTELEAEIYVFLLQSPPSTGYRIAKGVGRTNANTYKALQGLERKGAVLVEEDETRQCRAVPVEELLAQLRRRFEGAEVQARAALERLAPAPADSGVYNLRTRGQVLERARQMLAAARHIALLDLYPGLAEALREPVEEAAARGVRVTIKVYEQVELAGVETVLRREGSRITEALADDGLSLNVDGREHLLASLRRPDGPPAQAIWTSSPFLAFKLYYSLIYELILTHLQQEIRAGATGDRLRGLLDHYAYLHPISARNAVFEEYAAAVRAAEGETP